MIKIDLITGFLGAGKTTFIKKYASYFIKQGQTVGILENDYGAINVDMMLLQDLMSDNCELEMISGGCDEETHRRLNISRAHTTSSFVKRFISSTLISS